MGPRWDEFHECTRIRRSRVTFGSFLQEAKVIVEVADLRKPVFNHFLQVINQGLLAVCGFCLWKLPREKAQYLSDISAFDEILYAQIVSGTVHIYYMETRHRMCWWNLAVGWDLWFHWNRSCVFGSETRIQEQNISTDIYQADSHNWAPSCSFKDWFTKTRLRSDISTTEWPSSWDMTKATQVVET